MKKAYVIALVSVTDQRLYAEYRQQASQAIATYGGNVLVRGGDSDVREGSAPARAVVVEFPDIETARGFYESEEYSLARKIRAHAAMVTLLLVEGV